MKYICKKKEQIGEGRFSMNHLRLMGRFMVDEALLHLFRQDEAALVNILQRGDLHVGPHKIWGQGQVKSTYQPAKGAAWA
jgi:hypothetical protein